MTRVDAIRALIERVEAGEEPDPWQSFIPADLFALADDADLWPQNLCGAMQGSLDAVAPLEAPLKEGWIGPFIEPLPGGERHATWLRIGDAPVSVSGTAPDEAPARLLAVLRVLEWEAKHG